MFRSNLLYINMEETLFHILSSVLYQIHLRFTWHFLYLVSWFFKTQCFRKLLSFTKIHLFVLDFSETQFFSFKYGNQNLAKISGMFPSKIAFFSFGNIICACARCTLSVLYGIFSTLSSLTNTFLKTCSLFFQMDAYVPSVVFNILSYLHCFPLLFIF